MGCLAGGFGQCCLYGVQQQGGGVFGFFGALDVLGGLGVDDLCGDIVQGGLHQGIHSFDGFADVDQLYGVDMIGIHCDLHVEGGIVQRDGCGIHAGNVQILGGDRGGCGRGLPALPGPEHDEQQDQQQYGKCREQRSVDDFLHM